VNSSASAFNLAVADGWNQGAANASAVGGASASGYSTAESTTIAIADGPDTTAVAGAFCVELLNGDLSCVGGGASAVAGGTAEATNVAVANDANSAAFALGSATAENGGTAIESGNALAEEGGLAVAITNAYSGGGSATATNVQQASGSEDLDGNGDTNGIDTTTPTADGVVDISERAASAGAVTAIAGDESNTAVASSVGVATGTATIEQSSTAISNVATGLAGAGASTAVGCTQGQNSCGTALGVALSNGTEGFALSETAAFANGADQLGVTASAITPAQAGIGCTGGSYASLVQNADGSWSFSGGANAGFACTTAGVAAGQ
jgi:hypothetical protein